MRTTERVTLEVEAKDIWAAQKKLTWVIDPKWHIEHVQRVDQLGPGLFRCVIECSPAEDRRKARKGFTE